MGVPDVFSSFWLLALLLAAPLASSAKDTRKNY
jgi:hypothetical protein